VKNKQQSPLFGILLYGIGVVLGFFLMFVAAWADMEASAYDFPQLANAGLGGLHCPILMTANETRTISLNISNPTEDQISPAIKVILSTRFLPEEFLEGIQLMPGESKQLQWPVDAENIELGSFIFAKVLLYSAHPLPTREATCGIFILNLPGTGATIVPVLVALSLIGMGWGLQNMNKQSGPNERLKKHISSMTFLAIMIGLGLILSFIGGWISSVLVVVVTLLLIIILVGSFFVEKPK
jgi:hypothetical protein